MPPRRTRRGARRRFFEPTTTTQAAGPTREREPPTMTPQPGSAPGSLLVVDDDAGIRDAIADYLRSLGHRVETAVDCNDGVARMKDYPFDVAVCDVCLPDRDGYHLLEWAISNRPDTNVILL